MSVVTRGFRGRRRHDEELPPGQYLTTDFPVLSAGPTPRVNTDTWEFAVTLATGERHAWNWRQLRALPSETVTVDLHCVTKWSKLATTWTGVSLDTLLADISSTDISSADIASAGTSSAAIAGVGDFALVHAYGGYTTNLPLADLVDGKAWIAYEYDGAPVSPEHGGPARLLVPHLYLWKSAKWVREIQLLHHDEPGFWERAGYHNYGDPWREQRYWGD